MICLYDSKTTDFNNNGICILKPLDCIVKEELNGIFELELTHPLDNDGRWKDLIEDNIIKADTPKGPQLFRIYSKVKSMTSIKVYARHIFYDLLDNMLIDVRPTNLTGQNAIKYIFNNTLNPHNFTVDSDITIANTSYYVKKNVIEALLSDNENSFINRWGGELYRDNFTIHMNNAIGSDRGVKISYGKNLIGIEETLNMESVVTRAIPIGYNGITIPEIYIDSPLINSYGTIKTKEIKADHIKVNGEGQTDGYETLEEAQQALRDYVNDLYSKGLDKPITNYRVNFLELSKTEEYKNYAQLEIVLISDTVTIKHTKLGFDLKAKAISYVYNSLLKKYEKMELGSFKNDYIKASSNVFSKVEKVFNNKGEIDAGFLQGTIDFLNVDMKAMADSAEKHKSKAILFEDRIEGSSTYGAMAIGTKGFMIADELTPDGRDWNWRTFGTGKGFVADLIIAGRLIGNNAEFNLNEGYIEVVHSNGSKSRMDPAGFYRYDGTTNRDYHYLVYVGEASATTVNGSATMVINVPSQFHGKNYKCHAALSGFSSLDYGFVGKSIRIWSVQENYTNNTVKIYASSTGKNSSFNDDQSAQFNIEVTYILVV